MITLFGPKKQYGDQLQALKDLKEQRNFANISQFEKYVKRDPDNSSSNIAVKETQIYKG